MKVTYTPTDKKEIKAYLDKGDPALMHRTVSIEHPVDSMDLHDFMTEVIFPMLLGMGYSKFSIDKSITLNDEEDDIDFDLID